MSTHETHHPSPHPPRPAATSPACPACLPASLPVNVAVWNRTPTVALPLRRPPCVQDTGSALPHPTRHLSEPPACPPIMEHADYFSADRSTQHAAGAQTEDSDTDMAASATASSSRAMFNSPAAHARKPSRMSRSGAPRPIITPTSPLSSTLPHSLLPSAPASPPTPAPSPTPTQRVPDWSTAAEHEDSHIKNIRANFSDMNRAERLRLLGELLNLCDSQELSFVAEFVSPRLKKDPFMVLPTELCLRVCSQQLRWCML